MKKVEVYVFFDHRDSYIHGDLRIREAVRASLLSIYPTFLFEENVTYEEIVRRLVQKRKLPPLDDLRLCYNFVLQAFEASLFDPYPPDGVDFRYLPRSLSEPVALREGETLASTHLTHLVMDESEISDHRWSYPFRVKVLYCAASIGIKAPPPPKEKPSGTSPNWGQITIGGVLGFLIGESANVASIIGALDVIERRWREWHTTPHTHPQQGTSHLSATDIVAIRLRMTQGPDHEFVEWLTDPDRLKVYIEAFKESSIKPLQAIFVQRNDKALPVDVLEGAQNNRALDTLLSYLKTDSAQQ